MNTVTTKSERLSADELEKLVAETVDSISRAKWSVPFFATDNTNLYSNEIKK